MKKDESVEDFLDLSARMASVEVSLEAHLDEHEFDDGESSPPKDKCETCSHEHEPKPREWQVTIMGTGTVRAPTSDDAVRMVRLEYPIGATAEVSVRVEPSEPR